MGFFSQRSKPVIPNAHLPPAPPTQTFQPPPPWSPPQPWAQYGPQQPLNLVPTKQFTGPAHSHHDQFVSVEDFNAIQQALSQDTIVDQFDTIISDIDADRWNENDEDAFVLIEEQNGTQQAPVVETTRALAHNGTRCQARRSSKPAHQKVTIYSKVTLYANSKLPNNLPPLRLYINTWPLICLAAQYSRNVYLSPQNAQEKEVFVSADPRLGTKAMVMKSVPCDDKKTLIFAIRGTTLSIRDWCVNLDTSLVSPTGFLDDEGNLCHSGFLKVAKNMIEPIALRLRALLQENPNRSHCSLLITGHSAGGAIAALIFSHMLSNIRSQLSNLTSCFKRVHCITFGAPPVSLLPLSKPDSPKYQKYQFMSFLNEGDPVVRAEIAYMRSLYNLLSSPPPAPSRNRDRLASKSSYARLQNSISKLDLSLSKLDLTNPLPNPNNNTSQCLLRPNQPRITFAQCTSSPQHNNTTPAIWPVPMATLSNAGRLVLMQVPPPPCQKSRNASTSNLQRNGSNRWEKDNLTRVSAHKITDEDLRGVIFGDPTMHAMEVYLRRVDMLALKAVTART